MFCLGAESERSSIENGWKFECLTFGELLSILCFLVCLRLEAESRRKLGVVVGFLMHAAGTWLPTSFPLCFLSKVSIIDVPFLHEHKFLVWRFLIGILGRRSRLGIPENLQFFQSDDFIEHIRRRGQKKKTFLAGGVFSNLAWGPLEASLDPLEGLPTAACLLDQGRFNGFFVSLSWEAPRRPLR